jgi:hypothetical protein
VKTFKENLLALTLFTIQYPALTGALPIIWKVEQNFGSSLPKKLEGFWKSINSFVDIGGGSGYLTISICKEHLHLKGINSDLK